VRFRRWGQVVSVVVSLGVLTATAGASVSSSAGASTKAKEPLRIFMVGPTTGPVASATALSLNAAKVAVSLVNKHGGVLGKPVQLTFENDSGDTTTAVTELEAALSGSNKPAVFFQADSSDIAAATLPITNQAGILSMNGTPEGSSADPAKFPYNFDLTPSSTDKANAFCAEIKSLGAKTYGTINGDDPYGISTIQAVTSTCTNGLKSLGSEQYSDTATSLTPQLEALQGEHPAALVAASFAAAPGYLLQDLQQLGWNVPVVGDLTFALTPVITSKPPTGMLGTASEKNLYILAETSNVHSAHQSAALNGLITALEAKGPIPSELSVADWYDAVILAADAATAAGTTTNGASIAKALVKIPHGKPKTAILPAYNYTRTSHSVNSNAFTFVKPGPLTNGQIYPATS
jgi:branched-chain amino acid transport system substrate-binding protein